MEFQGYYYILLKLQMLHFYLHLFAYSFIANKEYAFKNTI